ncbi:TPA: hypothetical protein ACGOXG_001712 [Streptococcus suis]
MATNSKILHMHRAASYYETMQERYEEGFEKGAEQKTHEVLTSLFQVGMSDEDISLVLKIPIEQVRMLRKDIVAEKGPKHGN